MKIGTKVLVGWKMKKYDNKFKTRQGIIDEASRFFVVDISSQEPCDILSRDIYFLDRIF